ncbi:hypothetical protein BDQ12DRAFT_595444 [Crucibulum laeve]|uniref:Uncharacterized protein n=1 Tax=Crucibulum laeve TaxID=68775 RepID=A0A5C3MES0_9AGAR|nr:hypothetical protein BDQ12DRAFT_595444 [Crucibulum laeve]
MRNYNRSASLIITLFGLITNTALTLQVLAAWSSLKWEPESEWEASNDNWRVDGVKIFWALLSAYFASAAAVCAIGLAGILKNKPSFVRFYRDYSIADFSFCAFFTALATYGGFRTSARAGVCEEFSHHPELMRGMLEMGLNLENCERWLERAVFALLAVMFVIMVVRLHFLLAVSSYYTYLTLPRLPLPISLSSSSLPPLPSSNPTSNSNSTTSLRRIYLLPRGASSRSNTGDEEVEMVYTPVPLSSLPKDMQARAKEAWVSSSPSSSSFPHHLHHPHPHSHAEGERRHHHHRHHSHRRSSRSSSVNNQTGLIRLPIKPDEPLLPAYRSEGEDDKV